MAYGQWTGSSSRKSIPLTHTDYAVSAAWRLVLPVRATRRIFCRTYYNELRSALARLKRHQHADHHGPALPGAVPTGVMMMGAPGVNLTSEHGRYIAGARTFISTKLSLGGVPATSIAGCSICQCRICRVECSTVEAVPPASPPNYRPVAIVQVPRTNLPLFWVRPDKMKPNREPPTIQMKPTK